MYRGPKRYVFKRKKISKEDRARLEANLPLLEKEREAQAVFASHVRDLLAYARTPGYWDILRFSKLGQERFEKNDRIRQAREGLNPGVPDYVFLLRHKTAPNVKWYLWLEMKAEGISKSRDDDQSEWVHDLAEMPNSLSLLCSGSRHAIDTLHAVLGWQSHDLTMARLPEIEKPITPAKAKKLASRSNIL